MPESVPGPPAKNPVRTLLRAAVVLFLLAGGLVAEAMLTHKAGGRLIGIAIAAAAAALGGFFVYGALWYKRKK